MSYKKVVEKITEEEFQEFLIDTSCDLEGTTHFSEPIELAFSGGIYSMYCYEEESEEKKYILYSYEYDNNDNKIYDIWECE